MMAEWQTMDTAPKDGTPVLLRIKDGMFAFRSGAMSDCYYVVGRNWGDGWISDIMYFQGGDYGDHFPEQIDPEAWAPIIP